MFYFPQVSLYKIGDFEHFLADKNQKHLGHIREKCDVSISFIKPASSQHSVARIEGSEKDIQKSKVMIRNIISVCTVSFKLCLNLNFFVQCLSSF